MSPVRRTAAPRARRRNGRAAAGPGPRGSGALRYVLKLYVTGLSRASGLAIERVRDVCETHLLGRYELEVVDIYQKPALARDEQILATPTLIKVLPTPLRRYIGNLANVEKVLFGLDLREKR
jgi:circadian clock protein KaiB